MLVFSLDYILHVEQKLLSGYINIQIDNHCIACSVNYKHSIITSNCVYLLVSWK